MPVAHDEFGSEIDDFSGMKKAEMQYVLGTLLGGQITHVSYEPETGCVLLAVGHSMVLRCGAAHIKPGLLSEKSPGYELAS